MNSAALAAAAIRDDQRDPVGGRYERSADGKLTGAVREYAVLNLNRQLATIPSDADALTQLREFFAQAVKFGITTTQDMSDAIEPGRAVKLFEAAPTPIRIRIMTMAGTTPTGRDTQEGLSVPHHPSALITVSGTKWLLWTGVPLENTLTPRDVPFGSRRRTVRLRSAPSAAHIFRKGNGGDAARVAGKWQPDDVSRVGVCISGGDAGRDGRHRRKKVWYGKRVRFEHGDGLYPDLIPRAKDKSGHRRGAESDAFPILACYLVPRRPHLATASRFAR